MKLRTRNRNYDRRRLFRYFCIYSKDFQRHAFLHSFDVRNGFIRVQMCFFHTLSTPIPCLLACAPFSNICSGNVVKIWFGYVYSVCYFFYCHSLFLFSFPSVFPLNTICCMAVFFTRAHKTHFIWCFVFGKFGAKHLLLVIKIWTYILASTFNIGKDKVLLPVVALHCIEMTFIDGTS